MISENLSRLREVVSEKCRETGRTEQEVKIIAVSKTHPVSSIIEAKNAGAVYFGENKAQELKEKSEIIKEKINWHFIGHLQTNKVKYIAGLTELIHSVDSEKLADEINRRMELVNEIQKVLFEVNTAGEESKYGIKNLNDLLKLTDYCSKLQNVKVCGLMTMAPFTEDITTIRKCFEKARNWQDELNKRGCNFTELSMGMSGDFKIAIEEGSTMVRIGSMIFGDRSY